MTTNVQNHLKFASKDKKIKKYTARKMYEQQHNLISKNVIIYSMTCILGELYRE